jgi:hypothetical protein
MRVCINLMPASQAKKPSAKRQGVALSTIAAPKARRHQMIALHIRRSIHHKHVARLWVGLSAAILVDRKASRIGGKRVAQRR